MDRYIDLARRRRSAFVSIKHVMREILLVLDNYDTYYPCSWRLSDVFELFEINWSDLQMIRTCYLVNANVHKGKECYNAYLSMAADIFNECVSRGPNYQQDMYLHISYIDLYSGDYMDISAEWNRCKQIHAQISTWAMLRRLSCQNKK
jgi:hypothetical protein